MSEPQNFEISYAPDAAKQVLLPLPFEVEVLDAAASQYVAEVLSRWAEETGYTKQSHVEVATEYARYCSAIDPTRRGIALASEYLAWFLCLNDIPADDYKRSTLRDVRQVLQGKGVSPRPESKATHFFCMRLEARLPDSSLARFSWRTLQMLDAFEWEVEWLQQAPRVVPATTEYIQQRQHLIAHFPYVELWRLTEGIEIRSEQAWAALSRVEAANTQVIFWVNDILSTFRDARKGKLNLVACIAKEEKCEHSVALELAKLRLEKCMTDYVEAREALRGLVPTDQDISRHLRFLDSVLEGNRVATIALHDRFWGSG